ncbi:MAG TPA: hypothetical protein VFQ54_08050 [Thermomicrobiales bacterium]|nr:hypothetical protein [Thermomicrobiales bacterium]
MTIVLELAIVAIALVSGVFAIIRSMSGRQHPEGGSAGLISGRRHPRPDPDANPVYEWNDADWNEQRDRRAS